MADTARHKADKATGASGAKPRASKRGLAEAGSGIAEATARIARRLPTGALKRDMPLVPADAIAGRALVTLIAIMTFLAALTAGLAITVAGASRAWQGDLNREVTIQVSPLPDRDLDAEMARAASLAGGVRGVRGIDPYSSADSAKLLEPWLGSGLDLASLPVPRLAVVTLDPARPLDIAALRAALATVPGAVVDDHGVWLSRLGAMARASVLVGAGLFALVLTAMLFAVAFATRGAMAGAREVIEVLHFVGAADGFISRQFQIHFLRLGLAGGAIGGAAAIALFLAGGLLAAHWRASAGGEQIEAVFGSFGLGWPGYLAIAAIAGMIGMLTGAVSRLIVFRHLRQLN